MPEDHGRDQQNRQVNDCDEERCAGDEVVPIREAKVRGEKDPIFARLKGIVEIVGDPDDLIPPVFPLEDYDMLK